MYIKINVNSDIEAMDPGPIGMLHLKNTIRKVVEIVERTLWKAERVTLGATCFSSSAFPLAVALEILGKGAIRAQVFRTMLTSVKNARTEPRKYQVWRT